MTFSEALNRHMEQLELSGAALARLSGVSPSAMSRYRAGLRTPEPGSEAMEKLIAGLCAAAAQRGLPLQTDALRAQLNETVANGLSVPYDVYLANLNLLLRTLDVKSVSLARALSFDPSHISKILSGRRRPGNLPDFTRQTADYIARSFSLPQGVAAIANLLQKDPAALSDPAAAREALILWLGSTGTRGEDPVDRFLQSLDAFDLNTFIRSVRFDEIRLPSLPFQLPTTKTYTGIAEMMESELDFIKATLLSRSTEDCILYSDMPLEEMARDPAFPKKWMLGMAMLLKKGLRLHIIHDVHRPFPEMMLGLESHIPMYMTGQISPRYLPDAQGQVFSHLLKVSGAAALEGSAIAGFQPEGRYLLTKNREELRYYRQKAQRLLAASQPLMEIYRSDRAREFAVLMEKTRLARERQIVAESLPLCTMSAALLERFLKERRVPASAAETIRRHRADTEAQLLRLPEGSRIFLRYPKPGREQFAAAPLNLSLSELFIETDLPYTYELYAEHLKQTEDFCRRHPFVIPAPDPAPAFRNLSYTVVDDSTVIVSKNKSPSIHFVIRHPKMVRAFLAFSPPLREQ